MIYQYSNGKRKAGFGSDWIICDHCNNIGTTLLATLQLSRTILFLRFSVLHRNSVFSRAQGTWKGSK